MISGTASAHTGDVIGGGYIGRTEANFVLRINSSAQTNVLNYENVYQYGYSWNDLSSNVDLGVATAGGGMPTIANQLSVNGVKILSKAGGILLGRAVPFDQNNNRLGEDKNGDGYADTDINVDWAYSIVEMNISSDAESYYENAVSRGINMAKLVFTHEIGHILKLAHPAQSSSYSGHTYDGYPKAIMNKGSLANEPCMSYTITDHDKSCLIAKWGA